jgi:hypothetical protein
VRTRLGAAVAAAALVVAGCATEADPGLLAGSGPRVGDHLHIGYGVTVCGEEVDVAEHFDSAHGIHTHEDHVIHVHPHAPSGAGANATLGLFLDGSARVSLADGELTVDGVTLRDGDACGDQRGRVVVARWPDPSDAGSEPEVRETGLRDLPLWNHGEILVVAFVHDPSELSVPADAVGALERLGASYST